MAEDGPADERCEECGRLDPANCPCPPETDPGDEPDDEFIDTGGAPSYRQTGEEFDRN